MDLIFFIVLFIIAFLYSSVGHGGASGYLALMALLGLEPAFMRHSALILNVFVSTVAFMSFYKGGFFRIKLLLPLIVTSMPMAYIGSSININTTIYKFILALCLFIATVRILIKFKKNDKPLKHFPAWAGLLTGAIIGIISGFIGIGGGIILTPVLLLFRWSTVKQAAALSAIFILLNSVSGLIGLQNSFVNIDEKLIFMVIIAFAGGIAGSYMGSFRINFSGIKFILVTILVLATVKLVIV